MRGNLQERFWAKVKKPTEPNGCWEWRAGTSHNGYGQFETGSGRKDKKSVRAHRFSFSLHYADPGSLQVLHSCDNRRCVNPDHLFIGTNADNMRDMIAKGRDQKNSPKGERQWNSALTSDDVKMIRRMWADGVAQVALARQLGVTRHCVYCICHRKSWTHI